MDYHDDESVKAIDHVIKVLKPYNFNLTQLKDIRLFLKNKAEQKIIMESGEQLIKYDDRRIRIK